MLLVFKMNFEVVFHCAKNLRKSQAQCFTLHLPLTINTIITNLKHLKMTAFGKFLLQRLLFAGKKQASPRKTDKKSG